MACSLDLKRHISAVTMRCPVCGSGRHTWTVESRARADGSIRRRRECRHCRVRWTSSEVLVAGPTPLVPCPAPDDTLPHCSRCLQWQERLQRCGLGFPEALWQQDFAAECLHYQPNAAPVDQAAAA